VDVRSITQIDRATGSFDSVALFGNNLGLLTDRRRAVWVLRRFRRLVGSEGRVVGSNRDPYTTDDPRHLAYQARNRPRGRMGGQIRLRVRYRHQASPWFDYLFLSVDELREIAAAAGWSVRDVIDGAGPESAAVLEPARS
jgi:hypothetical protein